MRGLSEQISSNAITEKIAIDERSRELYEKITKLRSKILLYNEHLLVCILDICEYLLKFLLVYNPAILEPIVNH